MQVGDCPGRLFFPFKNPAEQVVRRPGTLRLIVSRDGNDPVGCHNAGVQYDEGNGVDADPERALSLYLKACGMDFGQSCHNAGYKVDVGEGVEINLAQAMELYLKACELFFKAGKAVF